MSYKDELNQMEKNLKRERPILVGAATPINLAQRFLEHLKKPMKRWRKDFYKFDGVCYRIIDEEVLIAELYTFLNNTDSLNAPKPTKKHPEPESNRVRIHPDRRMVGEVMAALPSQGLMVDEYIETPHWFHTKRSTHNMISFTNGMLDLDTMKLEENTPDLFTVNAVEFDYDPTAPKPQEWFNFLTSLWYADPECIACLKQVFGYLITQDTSQQKIFMLVGPKRSGKGTISKVLQALIGRSNFAGPTLAMLGNQYGAQNLIGKTLATIPDARLSGKRDQTVIVERLLSISGEDTISIERKYKDAWVGRLRTRFVMLTNEFPRFTDVSTALAGRFVVLQLIKSFYGQEDRGLIHRLLKELPGIMNWAIEGWQELDSDGSFTLPETSKLAQEEMEEITSPMRLFVRENCALDPNIEVDIDDLFDVWKEWCESNNRKFAGNKQMFGRDLRTVVPGITISTHRVGADRRRFYCGVGLR